jgi:hypothetical protein
MMPVYYISVLGYISLSFLVDNKLDAICTYTTITSTQGGFGHSKLHVLSVSACLQVLYIDKYDTYQAQASAASAYLRLS